MEFLPTVLVPGSLKIDTKDLKKKQFVLETEIEIILAWRQQIFDKLPADIRFSPSLEVQQTFERDYQYFMTSAASSKSKRTMIESGSLLCIIRRVAQTCVAKYRSNAKAAVFDYRILLFTQIGIFLNFAETKLKKRGKFEKNPI